jgi:transcriptional regulator with XRE-family HTH domain
MPTLDLRTARDRRRWNQVTLAKRSGVDQSLISRLENGFVANPSNDTVAKLEKALRLKRGTLVFGRAAEVA